MATMNIGFQPNLIGAMSQFSQFDATLRKHLANATEKAGGIIGDFQVEYMWANFKDPTGPLEDSVEVSLLTEYEAWIGPNAGMPYEWRRDRGFVGQFDVLGRGPFSDIGIYYAEQSIQDDATLLSVADAYIEAVYAAWNECVGNIPGGQSSMVSMNL